MEDFYYPSKLYKIRLVKTERDIFGGPISSNDWDKIVNLLYEDVKQEVFHFVHPKRSGIVYERNYKRCPVSGIAELEIGRVGYTTEYAKIRLNTKSYMYKEPYLAIEGYYPAFKNPEILAEIISRAYYWALKDYGLEVMLEPWENSEPIRWILDFEYSYEQELKKHPEIKKKCIAFQQAVAYQEIVKELGDFGKKRGSRKDDRSYRDCITVKDKDAVLKIAHEYSDGITKACVVMIVQRAMIDAGVLSRPSHRAFVEEFGSGEGRSASSYSEITNGKNFKYNKDRLYLKLLDIFTKIKNEQN